MRILLILPLLLLTSCQSYYSSMSREEVVSASEYCKGVGYEPVIVRDKYSRVILDVQCVPRKGWIHPKYTKD